MTRADLQYVVTAISDGEHDLVFVLANGDRFIGYIEPANMGSVVLIMNDADPKQPDNVFVEVAAVVAVHINS